MKGVYLTAAMFCNGYSLYKSSTSSRVMSQLLNMVMSG